MIGLVTLVNSAGDFCERADVLVESISSFSTDGKFVSMISFESKLLVDLPCAT